MQDINILNTILSYLKWSVSQHVVAFSLCLCISQIYRGIRNMVGVWGGRGAGGGGVTNTHPHLISGINM